jgi:hypothetical protein
VYYLLGKVFGTYNRKRKIFYPEIFWELGDPPMRHASPRTRSAKGARAEGDFFGKRRRSNQRFPYEPACQFLLSQARRLIRCSVAETRCSCGEQALFRKKFGTRCAGR